MSTDQRLPLLVFGASQAEYRRYILEQIAIDHPVILLDNEPPSWTRPYVVEQVAVDLSDRQAATVAVKEITARQPIAGVMTYLEHHIVLVAELARDLGLPGVDPEAARACRDKSRTRQLLREHGVPSARSHTVFSEQAAVGAAESIGYPVIIKPRGMAGSAGVRLCHGPQDIRDHYHLATTATVLNMEAEADGVLIEEYLDGPEISVETVVLGPGDIHIAFVTRKELSPPPAFQETGHTVDCNDELRYDSSIKAVVTDAVNAVGITLGVLHIEMRQTQDGWHIIEINARLGGELIPLMVKLITGVSLPQVTAALATGNTPSLDPFPREADLQAAGITFVYPDASGRLTSLHTTADPAACGWLERFVWTRQIGDDVVRPPHSELADRIAHFIVTGPDAATCRTRLAEMKKTLTVHTATPGDTGPGAP